MAILAVDSHKNVKPAKDAEARWEALKHIDTQLGQLCRAVERLSEVRALEASYLLLSREAVREARDEDEHMSALMSALKSRAGLLGAD